MASSPGPGHISPNANHNLTHSLNGIQQSGRSSSSPGLVNGSKQRVLLNEHHQQDQDAIVPASDQEPEDDSTDEDEDYNSYMQEQEHKQLQHHPHHHQQQHYDSGDEGENEADLDYHPGHQQQNQQQQRPHHHQHQQLQQIQQQYQLQQQQQLHAYKTQAMNIQQLLRRDLQNPDQDMNGTDSHEEEEFYNQNPQHDPLRQRELDIEMLQEQVRHDDPLEDDEDEDDFDDEDDEMDHDGEEDQMDEDMLDDEDDDEGSETMSLTEDDIDFNLVYAFHTFVATQEGQASVVRNDSLMLLEDANVYWWLVRVLKTGVIGYIPAENIETPFERLARLNTYRNVALSAPSPEWGTFDEHIEPLDPAVLEQRATNRRSVIFTTQNEFLEASETEWTEDEDEEGDWYEDDLEDEEEEEEEEEELEEDGESDQDHEAEEEHSIANDSWRDGHALTCNQDESMADGEEDEAERVALQLEAQRVQQEIMEDQRKMQAIAANHAASTSTATPATSITPQQPGHQNHEFEDKEDEDMEVSEDEEVQVTNRYRKPLLDEDDLLFSNAEPRVISLTPPIARDDSIVSRVQTPPGKPRNLRLAEESIKPQPQMQALKQQQLQQQQQQQQAVLHGSSGSGPKPSAGSTGLRSPSFEAAEEEKRKQKLRANMQKSETKLQAILGNKPPAPDPASKQAKESQEPVAEVAPVVTKKPGKFKSLFSVGKSKDKERKEKERQEKEKLKSQAKPSQAQALSSSGGIGNNIFRTRSNSNGSFGSATGGSSSSTVVSTPTVDKTEAPQDILTLRVYPGNVDFGASMYKTVVVTPSTIASDVAHQAVIKFRLAPDGTASTGDFFLTVRGVDGDETVLQATDKPMAIYQSLTAHLTTPLPTNHRLSISSVSSMMSMASTGSNSNGSTLSTPNGPPGQQTLRRTGSGRSEPQQKSIRFLLNKKIRRAGSISTASSLPSTPTTPTTPLQEELFWVKVVCQAQDLPQSMLLLEGMTTAIEKANPKALGQSVATKVELWIPMHASSNAGDVIFRTLEKVGIRCGVVDGVPEHILVSKRATVPNGLVIEYQLGLKLIGNTSRKFKQGDEIPLPPQMPLQRCFEDHQLTPVRRSPKADVASMPLHPDHVFFLRKATKSLQAEMRFVQEQLQLQQQQPRSTPLRTSGSDPSLSSRPVSGIITPSSPSHHARTFSAASVNSRLTQGNSGASSPTIRVPRRTDSVIMSSTSPIIRGNSFDNSSGRPSPTLSAHSLITTQQAPPAQLSRTPTPDRHQQVRTRSPSISQGSPPALARPLQAPSPAPSNQSVHADQQQEGSRSSTPERLSRLDRPDRQRATSPSLTHGPSPLSMAAVILQKDTTSPIPEEKEEGGPPMSLNVSMTSPPSSPISLQRRISTDAEIQVASVSSVGAVARNQSPMPTVVHVESNLNRSSSTGPGTPPPGRSSPGRSSPGRSSPASPSASTAALAAAAAAKAAMMMSTVGSSMQHGTRSLSPLPRPLRTPSPAVMVGQQQPLQALPHQLSIQTNVLGGAGGLSSASSSSGPSSAGVLESTPSRNNSLGGRSRSASASVAEISRSGSSSSRGLASPGANGSINSQDPWLLMSDYNTGMQDLLTLVRGGRSSSVSSQSPKGNSSAPSSLRGFRYQPQQQQQSFSQDRSQTMSSPPPSHGGSNTSTPTSRNRQISQPSSHQVSPALSHSSLYNNNNTIANQQPRNSNKDTPAHDNALDDSHNHHTNLQLLDKINTTLNDNPSNALGDVDAETFSSSYTNNNNTSNQTNSASSSNSTQWSRIWTRTDRRLWELREDCHPEVYECWQGVDADLDKVEKELDSLLATVKALAI